MVRILTAMTAAMLSAGVSASVAAAPGAEPAQQQIRQVVADISPQRIEAHVRKLVGFQTRHTMSDTVSDTRGIGAARRWIKAGARLQVAFDSHMAPVSKRIGAADGNRQRGGDLAG